MKQVHLFEKHYYMKLKIIALLIFVSCISAPSKAQDESVLSDSGNYCLWYDNQFSYDSVIHSFLLDFRSQQPYVPSIPASYENLVQIKQKIKVPESVFRQILNYNSVIQSSSESTKQAKIAKIIKEKACFYCGQVNISKKFDSHLFFLQHLNSDQVVEDGDMMNDDKMILVNLLNDTITSVSCMLKYFYWDGQLTYSQIDSNRNNDYMFYSVNGVGDLVFPNDSNTYNRKERIRFMFNVIGQIIILPLKY